MWLNKCEILIQQISCGTVTRNYDGAAAVFSLVGNWKLNLSAFIIPLSCFRSFVKKKYLSLPKSNGEFTVNSLIYANFLFFLLKGIWEYHFVVPSPKDKYVLIPFCLKLELLWWSFKRIIIRQIASNFQSPRKHILKYLINHVVLKVYTNTAKQC